MKRWMSLRLLVCVLVIAFPVIAGYAQKDHCNACSITVGKHLKDASRALVYARDSTAFLSWIKTNLRHVDVMRRSNRNFFDLSRLGQEDLQKLQSAPSVKAINLHRKAFPEREIGGVDLTLNTITTVHNKYPELDGTGLIASVKEGAFDKSDIDFYNRVFRPDAIPSDPSLHATIMATIVAGAGNSSPEGRGVARKARLSFASYDNLSPENTDQLRNDGITVQNHSYGTGIENEYGIESHLFDKQAFEYPELVLVFSAGNSGEDASFSGPYKNLQGYANLTGQFKMSKNTIVVGNTNGVGEVVPLSSRGPAHDGRIKPEMVSHGDQGTSEAAAIVSGTSLLLQQVYRDNNGGVLPPSSLIKAALVNSAHDRGNPNVDYEYGFGLIDALGSIETLRNGKYFVDAVSDNEVKTFTINVPASSQELKITLVWTDKEAEPGVTKALINDLDLEVFQVSSNTTFTPWCLSTAAHLDSLSKIAVRRPDHLNPIEQVTIPNATSGDYLIRVKGFDISGESQTFSIAYALVDDFEWTYPTGSDALVSGETKLLRWKWNSAPLTGSLQWRIQGDAGWQTISDVEMSDEYFSWNIPSINDVIEIRLSWGNDDFITDPVRVSTVLSPSIGYYCDPLGLAFWRDDGSESYRVFTLGEKLMEPVRSSDDTSYYKTEGSSQFMSVASVVKGKEGRRSRAIDFQRGVCYITSFLPDEVVTDSVSLVLTLGTNIGVKSFDLERLTPEGWMAVQSIEPVDNTMFVLNDPSPIAGTNKYQIRLTRESGEQVVSHIEEVFFIDEGALSFFPNPATRGEPITVIAETEVSTFWIHDTLGKSVQAFYDNAELKTIDTSALVSGVYIVKTNSSSGQLLMGRIVIK